jgi:hypothetical protein
VFRGADAWSAQHRADKLVEVAVMKSFPPFFGLSRGPKTKLNMRGFGDYIHLEENK